MLQLFEYTVVYFIIVHRNILYYGNYTVQYDIVSYCAMLYLAISLYYTTITPTGISIINGKGACLGGAVAALVPWGSGAAAPFTGLHNYQYHAPYCFFMLLL